MAYLKSRLASILGNHMKTTVETGKHINVLFILRKEIERGKYKPTSLGIAYNNSKGESPFDKVIPDVYDWNDLLPALCEELFEIHGD